MALDKAIQHKKEHRRPYRRAKAVDRTCCNHGSCKWCERNRTIQTKRAPQQSEQENEFFGYWHHPDPIDAIMDISWEMEEEWGTEAMEAEREWIEEHHYNKEQ